MASMFLVSAPVLNIQNMHARKMPAVGRGVGLLAAMAKPQRTTDSTLQGGAPESPGKLSARHAAHCIAAGGAQGQR